MALTKSKIIAFILAVLIQATHFYSFGQSVNDSVKREIQEILDPIQPSPEFPGGEIQLFCFIDKNLDKYKLKSADTTGTVVAQFVIDSTGEIRDVAIIKSLNKTVDDEWVRIIMLMPKWKPAYLQNKAISTYMKLPLRIPYENKFCK